MKNLIIILIFFWAYSIYSQELLYFNWGGYNINFEDTSEYKFVGIDTNNIWHITKPKKQILFLPPDDPYLGEYAIISDTNDYYPIKLKSSFQFKLLLECGCDVYRFEFSHKYDFEKNKDGGIIESSFDNGLSWQNIIYDPLINNYWEPNFGFYNINDTISSFNNQPGFTGLQSEMSSVFINFWNIGYIDTLLFRFTIVSDSINTNNEGWMLDDFIFGGILLGLNIHKNNNNIYIVPNPSNDVITINSPLEHIKKIEIFSSVGKRILEEYNTNSLYIDKIPAGFYLIKINDRYIEKLIIK